MEPSSEIPAFDSDRCASYLDGTRGAPPRDQLMRALGLAQPGGGHRALDVGCGPGKEVVELLRAGFDVVAIDPYRSMVELTRTRVRDEIPEAEGRLHLECARIEDFAAALPVSGFGLVHAGFVLPFIAKADFSRTFAALRAAVAPSGLLVAQFFGPDDEFVRTSPRGSMTYHAVGEVKPLLDGFDVIEHQEVNRAGFIGRGQPKWWHVHHVIARRIP